MALRNIFPHFWPILTAGLLGPTPLTAAVPEPLQEVLVTASLRRATLDELPASVSVLDANTLGSAGQQQLQDVLALVPNLNWAAGSSRPRYFQLRGVGEIEQWQGAPNPSVGFVVDDIDFSGVGMVATLFDLGQVEVLRGPQGTAYGANALAGLINVSSQEPRDAFESRVEASLGDFATRSAGAVLGGALDAQGHLAGRLVAQRYRSDGFRRNSFLQRSDTNGYDESTARGRLRWDAGARLRILLTGMWVDLDNGYDAFSLDNSRVTLSDQPGRDAQRSQAGSLRIDYDGNPWFTLRSATAAADSRIRYSFDGDWGHDPVYDFTSRFLRQHNTQSQDLRLVSRGRADDAQGWGWVAGVYALRVQETNDQLDLYNGDVYRAISSRYQATSTALYGQLEHRPSAPLTLTAGLRLERRRARYADTDDTRFSPSDTMLGGNLALNYALRPATHAYASLARGYKAGGFNIGAAVPSERRGFDPEFLWSAELGIKHHAAQERLRLQAALFAMRRTAMQVSTSVQLRAGDPLSFIYLTDNAARGDNSGLEGGASWVANERLTLSGTLAVLRTRFLGYQYGDRNLDGRDQAHAPRYQYSLAAQYRDPRGLRARLDLQGSAGFYFSESHDQRAAARTTLNARIGWEARRWSAMFYARNLFNANAVQRGFFFGNEPPDYPDRLYVQHGDPRQLGVTVNVDLQ